jgi:uncharacterized protein (TIGR02246 family)
MKTVSELVREYFAAYESKDRKALEGLLSDNFTFSSPLDDQISKEKYFERCWPNSEHHRVFHIEKLFEKGNEAFVTYECERNDGGSFRNTEFFRTEGGSVAHVDVYFGSETTKATDETEIRALIDDAVKASRAKDVAALIANYASDVLVFDVINPLRYTGSDAVGKRAADWFSSFRGAIDYELRDLSITTSDEAAFCHSLNHVIGTKTDGQKLDMWWRATVCWRKLDGKWRITHVHSSVPFDTETGKASLDFKP